MKSKSYHVCAKCHRINLRAGGCKTSCFLSTLAKYYTHWTIVSSHLNKMMQPLWKK